MLGSSNNENVSMEEGYVMKLDPNAADVRKLAEAMRKLEVRVMDLEMLTGIKERPKPKMSAAEKRWWESWAEQHPPQGGFD